MVSWKKSERSKCRDEILDESALEMFWFIDSNTAYGGRAALGPLFSAILNISGKNINYPKYNKSSIKMYTFCFTFILFSIVVGIVGRAYTTYYISCLPYVASV